MTALSAPSKALTPHPASAGRAAQAIDVTVERGAVGLLTLTYVVRGNLPGIYLPDLAAPLRTDELWKRTCFEVFIRPGGSEAYCEFNLAPSTRWAAYGFTACRTGMADLAIPTPEITARRRGEAYVLTAALDLSAVSSLVAPGAWSLNLTAVIEDMDGAHAWWALAHPSPNPDFHHPEAFVLSLPAPEGA